MGVFYSFSTAAASWIDAKTELKEVDEVSFTFQTTTKSALTANHGFRFCNFMDVYVDVGPSGLILNSGFYPDSRIYRGPSFANISSHAFDTKQSKSAGADAVTFRQIAGARTVSPEVIGEDVGGGVGTVGGAIAGGMALGAAIGTVPGAIVGGIIGGAIGFFSGRTAAHQITGFPPIWSILEITITKTGNASARLIQHSLFPSLTYYEQTDPTAVLGQNYARAYYYDAKKEKELPEWKDKGWGAIQGAASVSGGNPWGVTKGVMGADEDSPN